MANRTELLESISRTVSDYRANDGIRLCPQHVNQWVSQFSDDAQYPILFELDHVLRKTYFNADHVRSFLSHIISLPTTKGFDPEKFWRSVNLLDIQVRGGRSQSDFLEVFSELLVQKFGFDKSSCGEEKYIYLYIDDAIFTGERMMKDLCNWINASAPKYAKLYVFTIVSHEGSYYNRNKVLEYARSSEKSIEIVFWSYSRPNFENRRKYRNNSDVLWPSSIPNRSDVIEYVESLGFDACLRAGDGSGSREIFFSDHGRNILEQQFLIHGVHIRNSSGKFPKKARPLGHTSLNTLGFGSTVVTYRNCPNSAPLALWAGGASWYPLFPRKTNPGKRRDVDSTGEVL